MQCLLKPRLCIQCTLLSGSPVTCLEAPGFPELLPISRPAYIRACRWIVAVNCARLNSTPHHLPRGVNPPNLHPDLVSARPLLQCRFGCGRHRCRGGGGQQQRMVPVLLAAVTVATCLVASRRTMRPLAFAASSPVLRGCCRDAASARARH